MCQEKRSVPFDLDKVFIIGLDYKVKKWQNKTFTYFTLREGFFKNKVDHFFDFLKKLFFLKY